MASVRGIHQRKHRGVPARVESGNGIAIDRRRRISGRADAARPLEARGMDRPVRVSALERSARNVLSAFVLHDEWTRSFSRGDRVLSDNASLHAAMYEDGIEVVPVWSPEVRLTGQTLPLLVGWLEVLIEGRQVHFAQ
jgi:hypothetical protein